MKLLWISRLGYPCSYSYVSEGLLPFLVPDYDLYVFCTGIVHTEESRDKIAKQFKLSLDKVFIINKRLNNSDLAEDQEYFANYFFGIYHLEQIIRQVQPNIILSIDDNIALERQWTLIRSTSWCFDFEFIPYMTVDIANLPNRPNSPNIFNLYPVKRILTMTNFAEQEIYKVSPKISVCILPHIVDPAIFHQLPNKKELQNKWLNDDTSFVIGSINANNTRKRWDILLDSFFKFAQTHDNVILLIKTTYLKPQRNFGLVPCSEYDLEQLILETCQKYQLTTSKIKIFDKELSNVELNELYNCCDLGLSTTSGEGWGLTPCEMALCKIPQLVPEWSSFPNIFPKSQGLMQVREYPLYVGREYRNSPETLKDKFIAIIKTYIYHESITSEVDNINLTDEIATICISPNASNLQYSLNIKLLAHFGEIVQAIEFIQKYKFPDRFQILLGLDKDFLTKEVRNLDKLYEIFQENRRINYLLSPEILRKYWDLSLGSVGLVSVNTVVNTLEKFYKSSELRKSEGEYQYDEIYKICNPNIIVKKLHKYITDPI